MPNKEDRNLDTIKLIADYCVKIIREYEPEYEFEYNENYSSDLNVD